MEIIQVTFTLMHGCQVRFKDWHGLADIQSKPAFLRCGCVHITALDAQDRNQAEELLITPIEAGQAYGCRDAVLAELAARYAFWLNSTPAPEADKQTAPLSHLAALMALQDHLVHLPV